MTLWIEPSKDGVVHTPSAAVSETAAVARLGGTQMCGWIQASVRSPEMSQKWLSWLSPVQVWKKIPLFIKDDPQDKKDGLNPPVLIPFTALLQSSYCICFTLCQGFDNES